MSKATILYIEDNFENQVLVRRVLEAEGYTIVNAEDGTIGLEVAQKLVPDLILMDINLPELDGYEVTRRIRKIEGLSEVPIIAMTANVMQGDMEKTLEAGCDGYIRKPIDIDALPSDVERFLSYKNRKR